MKRDARLISHRRHLPGPEKIEKVIEDGSAGTTLVRAVTAVREGASRLVRVKGYGVPQEHSCIEALERPEHDFCRCFGRSVGSIAQR